MSNQPDMDGIFLQQNNNREEKNKLLFKCLLLLLLLLVLAQLDLLPDLDTPQTLDPLLAVGFSAAVCFLLVGCLLQFLRLLLPVFLLAVGLKLVLLLCRPLSQLLLP